MQVVLLLWVGLAPGVAGRGWGDGGTGPTRVGLGLLVVGAAVGASAVTALGRNLTPFPVPRRGAVLVTSGPYARVRHPIYSAVMLLALGWAAGTGSGLTWAGAAVLGLLFDAKARFEERALGRAFPAYAAYVRRTKRFLPFVY